MGEIILAEFQGNAWLVGGVEHIDDFLANTLPADVSIRVIARQSDSELSALWEENDGATGALAPWSVHPNIVRRAKGIVPGRSIVFGPWSAMLDGAARTVLLEVAAEAAKRTESPVVLKSADMTNEPKPMADLSNLRRALIEAELTSLGIDAARFAHATRPPAPDQPDGLDRIDLAFSTD